MNGLQYTGLSFQTVGWLTAAALLFITVFYILKLRKRSVEIPFSPLWNRVLSAQRHRTDWWHRFKRLFSWFLHLLLAALLLAAMLGPRTEDEALDGRHLLIMLDNSASMAATDVTGAVNRFDLARRNAREILETVGNQDRVMIALFSNRVQPLGPFTSDVSLLDSALQSQSVTANPTDLPQALRFAADSVQDRERTEVIILTDGAGRSPVDNFTIDFPNDTQVRHILLGEASSNLAVTAFTARRYPSNRLDHEIFVEITSYFDRPVEARLEIRADGRLVDQLPLSLEAGGVHRQFYPGQAVAGERLEARVRLTTADARDVLPLDDRAFATIPPPRRLSVQLVSTGNLFLEGPLLLNPHIDMERVDPSDYSPERSFDITIFDRVAPEAPAHGDLIYFDPPSEGSPFMIAGREDDPIITDVQKNHPLLRWIPLQDLNIGSTSTFARQANDVAIASAFGQPIIVVREAIDPDRRLIALGFDIRNSDFPLRVGFPIFILNVLDYFARDNVDLMYSFSTGESWSVPVDPSTQSARIQTPDGRTLPAAIYDARAHFYGETPGFYRLRTEAETITVAANLASPLESDVTPQVIELGDREISNELDSLLFDRREIWIYLLLAAMLLLLIEWFTYNRRLTV